MGSTKTKLSFVLGFVFANLGDNLAGSYRPGYSVTSIMEDHCALRHNANTDEKSKKESSTMVSWWGSSSSDQREETQPGRSKYDKLD